jgi:hypothetical protein
VRFRGRCREGRLLEATLRRAAEMDAEELGLLSGVGSLAKIESRVRTVRPDPLSAEAARALHEECLGLAGRMDLCTAAHARYEFIFPDVGTFQCDFISRRRTSNLRLRRGPETLIVEPTRKRALPPLAAEATPDPSFAPEPLERPGELDSVGASPNPGQKRMRDEISIAVIGSRVQGSSAEAQSPIVRRTSVRRR